MLGGETLKRGGWAPGAASVDHVIEKKEPRSQCRQLRGSGGWVGGLGAAAPSQAWYKLPAAPGMNFGTEKAAQRGARWVGLREGALLGEYQLCVPHSAHVSGLRLCTTILHLQRDGAGIGDVLTHGELAAACTVRRRYSQAVSWFQSPC